jgi:hypothetical protein
VVRGIAFVYLPPPRRKVPYAAAIASAPLPRYIAAAMPGTFPPTLQRMTQHCMRVWGFDLQSIDRTCNRWP